VIFAITLEHSCELCAKTVCIILFGSLIFGKLTAFNSYSLNSYNPFILVGNQNHHIRAVLPRLLPPICGVILTFSKPLSSVRNSPLLLGSFLEKTSIAATCYFRFNAFAGLNVLRTNPLEDLQNNATILHW